VDFNRDSDTGNIIIPGQGSVEKPTKIPKDLTKKLVDFSILGTKSEGDQDMKEFGGIVTLAKKYDLSFGFDFVDTEEFGYSFFFIVEGVPVNGKKHTALIPIASSIPEKDLIKIMKESLMQIIEVCIQDGD
jgi:hypothetical protein